MIVYCISKQFTLGRCINYSQLTVMSAGPQTVINVHKHVFTKHAECVLHCTEHMHQTY